MVEFKKYYIDDIATLTKAMIEGASKKHKSFNAYCIFVEGDRYHMIVPTYESGAQERKETRRMMSALLADPEACEAFAKIVVPPARYFERQAKKQRPSSGLHRG